MFNRRTKKDFLFFEGNAQGFRILSRLQILSDRHGVNFTYGTLASLIKYPWYSSDANLNKTNSPKFGCFQSEKELFEDIKKCTGIGGNQRHPSTLLMEAADDIAYLPTDLEDAVKKGAVSWNCISDGIMPEIRKNHPNDYGKLITRLEEVKENKVPEIELINMQLLKITIQGILIKEVIQTFKDNYSKIMDGSFNSKLISESKAKYLDEVCSKLCVKYVFSNKEVITLELVGDKVLTEILSLFVDAVVKIDDTKKSKRKEQKLYNLISENFRYAKLLDNNRPYGLKFNDLSLYDRLQLVTDFVSGMTDSYAVSLHQQLLGVKMP